MSALLVEDLVGETPAHSLVGSWRHMERGAQGRPQLVALPGGDLGAVAAPGLRSGAVAPVAERPSVAVGSDSWQLTDRGIAVAVVLFLAVVVAAAVVMVGAFLSVSNAPLPQVSTVQAGASGQV